VKNTYTFYVSYSNPGEGTGGDGSYPVIRDSFEIAAKFDV
jgi:hypothetical protein